jgi:hypothetical protein
MITREQWRTIKHFRPNEKDHRRRTGAFGDLNLFEFGVLRILDQQTDYIKTIYKELDPSRKIYCIVHCGTQGTHSEGSQHYLGLAVDVHYVGLSLYEQVMFSTMFPWSGIGFYPTWKHQGLHLDMRKVEWYERRSMWYTYQVEETVNSKIKLVTKYEDNKIAVVSRIAELSLAA